MGRAQSIIIVALAAASLLGGCTTAAKMPPRAMVEVESPPDEEWRAIATAEDTDRVERAREAWSVALGEARARGFGRAIAEEGELLDPDIALARPAPPPGPYYCRTIKLGRQGRGRPFASYRPFFCYVEAENELLTFVKQTGSQRPAGRIYGAGADDRLIFLGSLVLGEEEEIVPYGQEAARDMAGIVERVGPHRYRIAFPWPRDESKLDVIELVPFTGL